MAERTYQVFAGLHEESKEGWIWLSPGHEHLSDYVRVRNPGTSKSVVCERRLLDENFRSFYNQRGGTIALPDLGDVVVMNWWFRKHLGDIATQADVRLDVASATWWESHITASWHHPHPAVRVGLTLGFISVGLGFLGLVLGIIGLVGSCFLCRPTPP